MSTSLLGGGLRFARSVAGEKSAFTEETKSHPLNVLKFRGRLHTYDGCDVHREVCGAYFPRHRCTYVNEIKDTQRLGEHGIKLISLYNEDVYLKEDGDYFYTEDFKVGAQLKLGVATGAAAKGKSPTIIVTDVDDSKLSYRTAGPHKGEEGEPEVAPAATWDKTTFLSLGTMLFSAGSARVQERVASLKQVQAQRAGIFALNNGQEAYSLLVQLGEAAGGQVSWDSFIRAACGPPNEYRNMCIAAAFKKIDYNKDFVVTLQELQEFYCPKYHPKVLTGESFEGDIMEKFIGAFAQYAVDGLVTFAQFCDYYQGASTRISDDDTFLFMMERCYNLDNRNLTSAPFR